MFVNVFYVFFALFIKKCNFTNYNYTLNPQVNVNNNVEKSVKLML